MIRSFRPERKELFRFFTHSPFPLTSFVSDATRTTYALFNGDRPVAQTSVYNADEQEKAVTLGFTFVLPNERGAGHNAVLKAAIFRELAARGVRHVWFRLDESNAKSRRGVERSGAEFSHVEDAPREYPDGRVAVRSTSAVSFASRIGFCGFQRFRGARAECG